MLVTNNAGVIICHHVTPLNMTSCRLFCTLQVVLLESKKVCMGVIFGKIILKRKRGRTTSYEPKKNLNIIRKSLIRIFKQIGSSKFPIFFFFLGNLINTGQFFSNIVQMLSVTLLPSQNKGKCRLVAYWTEHTEPI